MNEINIKMSATRMAMFLQCKWKYFCNYILHKPRLPNVSFKLGLAVHEALKVAGKIWKNKEKFIPYDIQRIKNTYRKTAAREGIEDLSIYEEGLRMVLDKIKEFEVGKIVDVEDKFEIVTDDGVPIIGAMDKIIELNKDTILIVDYKTSKFFYTPDEMKGDIQLSIYDIVGSIKFPQYKRIILCLDYLRGEPLYTYRTYQERKVFSKYLLAVYNEMLIFEEKEANPSINDMCNWCDFRNDCPAYVEAAKNNKIFKKNLVDCNDNELVEEYIDIRSRKRILDNYEKELKTYILKKINADEQDLDDGKNVIYVRQNPSTVYNPKTVYEAIPLNEFLKMISVSKKLLDNYMEENVVDRSKIIETSIKSYTSPFLAIRNLNK